MDFPPPVLSGPRQEIPPRGAQGVRAMGKEVRATCDSGRVRGDSVRASGILFCAHQTS